MAKSGGRGERKGVAAPIDFKDLQRLSGCDLRGGQSALGAEEFQYIGCCNTWSKWLLGVKLVLQSSSTNSPLACSTICDQVFSYSLFVMALSDDEDHEEHRQRRKRARKQLEQVRFPAARESY